MPEPRIFEIYECGDPYSRAWDCTEYADPAFHKAGVGTYRGDISGRMLRDGLKWYLKRAYPDCVIYNRETGSMLR